LTTTALFPYTTRFRSLACSIQDDACLGEDFRLRGAADQAVRRSDPAGLGCTASDLACLAAAWLRIDKPNQSRLTAVMEARGWPRSEEHTSELQSREKL